MKNIELDVHVQVAMQMTVQSRPRILRCHAV